MKFKSPLFFAFIGLNLWNTPFPKTDFCLQPPPLENGFGVSLKMLKPEIQTCFLKGGSARLVTALRSLGDWKLAVLPGTTLMRFVRSSCLVCEPQPPPPLENPYLIAVQRYNVSDGISNQGFRAIRSSHRVLSADLCPSPKPLDRRPFEALLKRNNLPRPIPFLLAASGRWLETHSEDLSWLKKLEQEGLFEWTWVNHSYGHPHKPGAPNAENFLNLPASDLTREVLRTEMTMISRGLTPSIFFRFPGLISSRALHQELSSLGLIPLGSNGWLAKGQRANPGSIVLVHANGNEPKGIQELLPLIATGKLDPLAGISFNDLLEGVSGTGAYYQER